MFRKPPIPGKYGYSMDVELNVIHCGDTSAAKSAASRKYGGIVGLFEANSLSIKFGTNEGNSAKNESAAQ